MTNVKTGIFKKRYLHANSASVQVSQFNACSFCCNDRPLCSPCSPPSISSSDRKMTPPVIIEKALTRLYFCINTEFVLSLISNSDMNELLLAETPPNFIWDMTPLYKIFPYEFSYSPRSISLQTFVNRSEMLIDEPVRRRRGSDGGEFSRLIHISPPAYISSSTSVFQPSAWFMEEIWIETKTLANTNAEWLIFKWEALSQVCYSV